MSLERESNLSLMQRERPAYKRALERGGQWLYAEAGCDDGESDEVDGRASKVLKAKSEAREKAFEIKLFGVLKFTRWRKP